MKWFWRRKPVSDMASRVKSASLIEGLETLQELWDTTRQLCKDMGTVNTALARIEKKQMRWLEIINSRDGQPEKNGDASPSELKPPLLSFPTPEPPKEGEVGEELRDYAPIL